MTASAAAVVLIAVGGYAAWGFFFSGGPRPAEVLPDSTFALATVDLDPSGGQKVEAIKTLRRFPSWRERTGLTADSDVMKVIFEKAIAGGSCASLDYERDVQPWIGQRLGVGGVLIDELPVPVLALQVKDAAKAKDGFAALVECGEPGEDFGWTLADDYVVASDSTQHAEVIVAAGRKAPLDADADFARWTEEAGGAGILNAYVGSRAAEVLRDELDSRGGMPGLGGASPDDGEGGGEVPAALKDFEGAAATLRFADGGIEVEFAAGGLGLDKGTLVGDHVGALPQDTAAALAFSVPERAVTGLTSADGMLGGLVNGFGSGTGLDLPEDLVTLVGESMSLSLGADAPADLDDVNDSQDLPVGLLVHGDEEKIRGVVEKVEARLGASLTDLPATLASTEGKVAVASTPEYADDLLGAGGLADSEAFREVVPELDRARVVGYVSLDNAWVTALGKMARADKDAEATEVMENVEVLRALGLSSWADGDTARALVRISLR